MNIEPLNSHIKKGQLQESDFLDELTKLNNELVNLQRSVVKQNSELTNLNEDKSLLLGMAVHDLRNPLGVIISLSELLLDDENQLSEEHLTFIQMIKSTSAQMQNIICDMLDFAAIETGKLILHKSDQEIDKLIEKNIQLNKRIAEKKQINILFNNKIMKSSISIDPDKIDQVLNNIIFNAIKFSESGKTIDVDLEDKNDFVIIAIKDQGVGIPAANLDKLFTPLNKNIRRKGTAGEASTGFGLVITQKIVKAHDGDIKVESKEGEGTTFFISLPYN